MLTLAKPVPACRPDLVIRSLGNGDRYVVKDPLTGAFFTFGAPEAFLLYQLDGRRDAAAVCRAFEKRFGEALCEDEVEEFIGLVRGRGFLDDEQPACPGTPGCGAPDAPACPQPAPAVAGPSPAPASVQSILYWRKCIFDPDPFLGWLAPRVRFLWTGAFLFTSLACIALAAVLVWTRTGELVSGFAFAWRWETALVVWLTLLAATICHEFAHGLTCKHYGGEVHEIGFLALYFIPCLYCNVSDAWLFREKSRRLLVTLAGGYCDLCLWAVAVFVWRLAAPETLPNYLALVILTVLGARVFFNFNPLLKLDGYYLLSDALEIPNLRQRSWERVAGWSRCLLWGALRPAPVPNARVLLVYGLLSWLFSVLFLGLMILGLYAFFAAHWGAALGAAPALALAALSGPGLFSGFTGGEVGRMVTTRYVRTAAWAAAPVCLGALLFLGRVEDHAGGPFEVAAPGRAELRAPVAGFLREVYVDEGQRVYTGTVVAIIEVPDLDSRTARKGAEVREAEARLRLLRAGPRREEVAEQRGRVTRARAWRDRAEEDLGRATRALRQDLTDLDQQIEEQTAEQEFAQVVLDRSRGLMRLKALATEQYQEAEKQRVLARARRLRAQACKQALQERGTVVQETELARRQKDLADAEAALRLLEAGPRPEEVEAECARLARLQEEARYLEEVRGKLQVRSPVGGLVTTPRMKEKVRRYLQEGELIAEVEDPDALEAEVSLAEADVGRVQPGMAVELKCRGLPWQTIRGEVREAAPRATRAEPATASTRPARGELPSTVTVYCRVEEAGAGLRPGMTGHARVCCGRRAPGVLIAERLLRYLRTEFWW